MKYFYLDRKIARLILLQRNELTSPSLKKIRKLFGRYIFTNFFSKYMISPKLISSNYYALMNKEYEFLTKHADLKNKKILSIGSGMCGLELIINSKSLNNHFTIIEKDYVSKKVSYGWDNKNKEAYNSINLLKSFLINNGMKKESFEIYDFDKGNFPIEKYEYIISLYSLDYHYDFFNYFEYFKKVIGENTNIIFDTIRPKFFKKIFENVEIISSEIKSIHSSKRVICNKLLR